MIVPVARIQPRLVYLAIAAMLFVVARLALAYGTQNQVYLAWQPFDQNLWVDGWCRWDAMWYRAIAHGGYWFVPEEQSSVAFFPLYPAFIALLSELSSWRELRIGVLVTLIAGLTAAVLFDRWCAFKLDVQRRQVALLTLLLYPFSFFLFGAAYSDALFLALAIGSFVLLERDQPVLAGLVAAFATATRPVGIVLVLGLVVRLLELRGAFKAGFKPRQQLHPKDAGVLLSVVGLVAYCFYLWRMFGAPLAFAQSQVGWGQAPGPHTWFKVELFELFVNKPWSQFHGIVTIHAVCTLGALALVPAVKRRFGWGYAVYVAAAIAVPALSSKDFMGLGRYLLAAFPLFAVVGEWLAERPRARWVIHAAQASMLIWLTAMFALWEYVS